MTHCQATKRVLIYLQRIKNYMLTYKKIKELEIIGYSDYDLARCIDRKNQL